MTDETIVSRKGLTPKQQRFVEEYLVDLNGTQAAIRAGYSAKTASSQAEELLRKPEIAAAVERKRERLSVKTDITVAWIINRLVELVDRCMQKEPVLDNQGMPTGEWKFDSRGATKALELLGKHFGAWVADQVPQDPAGLLALLTNGRGNGHGNGVERVVYDA